MTLKIAVTVCNLLKFKLNDDPVNSPTKDINSRSKFILRTNRFRDIRKSG